MRIIPARSEPLTSSTRQAAPSRSPLGRIPLARGAIAAAVALGLAVFVGAAMPASATPAPPAGLSVSVTGDTEEVSPDSTVGYHAVVQNTGAAAAEVRLQFSVPTFATITDAPGAEAGGTTSSWLLTIEPGVPFEVDVAVQIGEIPANDLWSAARLDVFAPEGTTAIVGASSVVPVVGTEEARVQAAADVEQTLARLAEEAGGESIEKADGPALLDLLVIGGALLVVVLAVAAVFVGRRARKRAIAVAVDAEASADAGQTGSAPVAEPAAPTRRSIRERKLP